jgi:hypothetical protein
MARMTIAEVTAEVLRKRCGSDAERKPPIPPAQASASAPLPRAGAGLRETSEARMGRRKTTMPDPSVDVSSSSTYRIQAMVDGLGQLALAMERKWGVDRLRLLVSDLLRAKFDEQKDRLDQALATNNEAFVRAQVEGMRRAWTALDRAHATRARCHSRHRCGNACCPTPARSCRSCGPRLRLTTLPAQAEYSRWRRSPS